MPSTLVSLGLLAVVIGWSPGGIAGLGWLLILLGVAARRRAWGSGSGTGCCPCPAALDAPDATGRWALIALHVALIVVGLALAASALLAG